MTFKSIHTNAGSVQREQIYFFVTKVSIEKPT
jgi:hypothetical protein